MMASVKLAPTRWGSMPRRVVSTSGSSGTGSAEDVNDDGKHVTGAAAEHEEVPDRVVEGKLPPREKQRAEGVATATRHEPPEPGGGQGFREGTHHQQHQPAHRDVQQGGDPVVLLALENGFHDHPGEGEK